MKKVLLVAALLIGCGGEEGAPPKTTASAASASGSASASASAPTSVATDCIAGLVSEAPPGWVAAGKLVIVLEGDQPKHADAFDSAGKKTLSIDIAGHGREIHTALSKAICSAGALGAVAPTDKPSGGTATLAMVKPTNTDPANDIAMMCGAAPAMPSEVDPSQAMRLAAATYGERLVSSKWRTWLYAFGDQMDAATDDPARTAIKKKRGDELDAAATKKPCWFADALHGTVK